MSVQKVSGVEGRTIQDGPQTTNRLKFQTKNPVVIHMLEGFFSALRKELLHFRPATVLDAGCGEAETIERLRDVMPPLVEGVDIRADCIAFAENRFPQFRFQEGSVYELPFDDRSFDLVMCCEVLEHLDSPGEALRELCRVARKGLLLSVPHEPWFRLGSLARGRYLRTFGNHPEHVQHWNLTTFNRLVKGISPGARVKSAFPWMIASVPLGLSGRKL